jgi:hypothetical protein
MDLRSLFRNRARRTAGTAPAATPRDPGGRERSATQLEERIRTDPNDRGSRLELAQALVGQNRFIEAVAQYLAVADIHVDNDRYEAALRTVRTALAVEPENLEAAERLARLERVRSTLARRDRIVERLSTAANAPDRGLTARDIRRSWPGLGGAPLVQDLSDDQLVRVLGVSELREFGDRVVLGRQGQHQPQAHLIVRGTVEAVTPSGTGASRVLLQFGPGDLLGDSLLLGDGGLPATLRTGEGLTTALRLTKRGLTAALQGMQDPQGLLAALRRHGRDREVAALFPLP